MSETTCDSGTGMALQPDTDESDISPQAPNADWSATPESDISPQAPNADWSATPESDISPQAPNADWSATPEVILMKVFQWLPILDRQSMSRVCSAWKAASASPLVWRKFEYGVNFPQEMDFGARVTELKRHHRSYMMAVYRYSEMFVHVHIVLHCDESFLVFKALTDLCNSLKFSTVELYDESMQTPQNFKQTLFFFLSGNTGVQELCLKNIDFEGDRQYSPLPIGPAHAKMLRKLTFLNAFKQNNLSSLMYLVNLTELTIFPQDLRYTWIKHLTDSSLRTLNFVGFSGMWHLGYHSLLEDGWRHIAETSPLRVHCYLMNLSSKVMCPGMPLATIVSCDYFRLTFDRILKIIQPFSETLTTFVDFSLTEKSYKYVPLTADDHVISIVQRFSKLRTLAIKECLHSSTLLLMVHLNPNLQDPIIREDMIEYDLYVPKDLSVPQHVLKFMGENFHANKFAAAMSSVLKKDWRPLPVDQYFKVIKGRYMWYSSPVIHVIHALPFLDTTPRSESPLRV